MKLLQINSTLNWGSTGRIAEEIGQVVLKKGWESYVAYGRYNCSSKSQAIKIGNKWTVYNHVLQTRLFDKHGLTSCKQTKLLIKQIKAIAPNVIHLHNIHGYYLNYQILFDFLSKANIPIIWTLHDCWPFTGHCSHYAYIGCERWHTGCYNCPQKADYPKSWLADHSKLNYQAKLRAFTSVKNMILVPVSEWLADEVRCSFLKEYPIQVIHNGIDTTIFNPQQVCLNNLGFENRFVILGVASVWSFRKGLQDFVSLRKSLPDNFVIILIGLNEKQINQLPKGIMGIRRTDSVQELAAYYSAADVFFNPTWEDNFPTTNLEALSCGTPVITYRTGGSVEAIDDKTGFIVEQGDIHATVDIVRRMKDQDKQQWKSACRERAVSLYNKEERYMEYLQLYEKMLSLK